jgi:hypothetical protein
MAFGMSSRTLIFAGVGLLVAVAAGAGAWLFLFDEEAPPPKVASAPAKPAADGKAAPAADAKAAPAKPAADDGKGAAKPAAPAAAAAAAPKPAAPAKPVPKDPTQLVNEVIAGAGLRVYFQTFAREAMLGAGIDPGGSSEDARPRDLTAAEVRAAVEAVERAFEPAKFDAELAANLKTNLEIERMGRFLELLRQPVAQKLTAEERRNVPHEVVLEQLEGFRKTPLSQEKAKHIQALDEVTQTSEVGADMIGAMARDLVDGMLAGIQKTSKNIPKETRQRLGTQLNAMRAQARNQIRGVMAVMYRNSSEEELGEFVKLLDADTGRWASGLLANALRPMLVARGSMLGKEFAQIAMAGQPTRAAKPKPEAVAKAETKGEAAPAAEPRAAAKPAAPAEPPAYRRAEGTRELYARYNDLVTATVMRDRAAVKELLDDGKPANSRQSDGMTALMVASGNGDAEIAQMLLAKGADPNLRTSDGATALSIARERRRAEMVQLLQKHGAR